MFLHCSRQLLMTFAKEKKKVKLFSSSYFTKTKASMKRKAVDDLGTQPMLVSQALSYPSNSCWVV